MIFQRQLAMERGRISDDGEFRLTLFTDGEASDGDILDIRGGQLPKRMPMFVNHVADPLLQPGSLTNPEREVADGGKLGSSRVRYTGRLDLDGPQDWLSEVAQRLHYMIGQGDVESMSGRWDAEAGDWVPRINLPSNHPAYVDSQTAKGRKRYGWYFKRWTALEGSIVGIGADPKALIGRAQESQHEQARTWWRRMAEAHEQQAYVDPRRDECVDTIRGAMAEAMQRGLSGDDVAALVVGDGDMARVTMSDGGEVYVPARYARELDSRATLSEIREDVDELLALARDGAEDQANEPAEPAPREQDTPPPTDPAEEAGRVVRALAPVIRDMFRQGASQLTGRR